MVEHEELREWLRSHVKLHEKALDKVMSTLEDEVWVFCQLDLARLRVKQGLHSIFPPLVADDITAAIDAVAWEGMEAGAPSLAPRQAPAPGPATSLPRSQEERGRPLAHAPAAQPRVPPTLPVRAAPPAPKPLPKVWLGEAALVETTPQPQKPSAEYGMSKGTAPPGEPVRTFFADGRPKPAPVDFDLNFDFFFCLGFNAVVVVAAAAAIATMYAYYSPEDLGLGRVLAADGSTNSMLAH